MQIRLAIDSDIEELMDMWEESVAEIRAVDGIAAQVDLAKRSERRQFFDFLIHSSDSGVTVAEDESGGLVGMLTYQEFTNPAFFTVVRLALISSVHVRPNRRREGIAQQMTEVTLEWLRNSGVQEVQLANSPWNLPADRTWEKLGFEVVTVTRRRLLSP